MRKSISNFGISAKTSLITGGIVFILLSLVSVFLLRFESNLVNFFINEHISRIEKTLEEQLEVQKKASREKFQVDAKIASGFAASFIYNFDSDGLNVSLSPYMDIPSILAIQVSDTNGAPFAAVWKDDGVKMGSDLPETLALDLKLSTQADSNFEGEKVGVVQVYYTEEFLQKQMAKDKKKTEAAIVSFRNIADEKLDIALKTELIAVMVVLIVLIFSIVVCLKYIAINPIQTIINGLSSGARNLTSSSNQLSASSRSVAEAASSQAASLEETSASLETMTQMTQQNADNAGEADALMKEVNNSVTEVMGAMEELSSSMDEASSASNETFNIIKTIDGIAFQTNLLALNAAVEAARAGDAGAGFAVVADEVRNLAQRSAEAARSTAGLIEGTVKKISHGTDLVKKTNTLFTDVVTRVEQTGVNLGKIASASKDQASGITQINTAVEEMDKIVQHTAATSEESAGASLEVSSQTQSVNEFINNLASLIGQEVERFVPEDSEAMQEEPNTTRQNSFFLE